MTERQWVGTGATASLVGIALCASDSANLGAWVTLAGLLVMLWGVHRFGRSGPDASVT